jgi:hypothetical protein
MKPRAALNDSSTASPAIVADNACRGAATGHSDETTAYRAPLRPHPAFGHGRSASSFTEAESSHTPGSVSRLPIQVAAGTLTALPTKRQRARTPRGSRSAGKVHPRANPCNASASLIEGVTIFFCCGTHMPGGAAIPSPEATFSGGTASTAQPTIALGPIEPAGLAAVELRQSRPSDIG